MPGGNWTAPRRRETQDWGRNEEMTGGAGGGGGGGVLSGAASSDDGPSPVLRISQPPSESLVDLDQALGDFAAGLGERVLLQHQVLLELSDAGEVDGARLILHEAQCDGLLGLVDAFGLEPRARLGHAET